MQLCQLMWRHLTTQQHTLTAATYAALHPPLHGGCNPVVPAALLVCRCHCAPSSPFPCTHCRVIHSHQSHATKMCLLSPVGSHSLGKITSTSGPSAAAEAPNSTCKLYMVLPIKTEQCGGLCSQAKPCRPCAEASSAPEGQVLNLRSAARHTARQVLAATPTPHITKQPSK